MSEPLVYATKKALADWSRLDPPPGLLEREVAGAIREGRLRFHPPMVLGDEWEARVERRPGRLRPKPRSWLVLSVDLTKGANRYAHDTA
jgi:hypothetical protein